MPNHLATAKHPRGFPHAKHVLVTIGKEVGPQEVEEGQHLELGRFSQGKGEADDALFSFLHLFLLFV